MLGYIKDIIKSTVDYSKDKKIQEAINREEHKKFCVLPFIHLATTTEGNCRLCCKVSKTDVITDENGEPYNVNKHSIDEIWNSEYMRDVRMRLLNDEQIPQCKTCWNEEDIFYSEWSKDHMRKGEIPSKRRFENQKWLHKEKTKLDTAWTDIVNKPRIRYLDIRLSNLCNLKCRMCWPHFSSQISKEQQEFAQQGLPTWYKNYEIDEWDTAKLWQGIRANLVELQEITFVGGEPTLHEEMYELLDHLVETGLSQDIRLKFTTNLTNIQERFYYYAGNFKNTVINGSIDGVGDTAEYIRFPSDWATVERNIDRMLQSRRENFLSITLTPVIQIYNLWNIRDMVRWYVDKWLNLEDGKTKKYFVLHMDLLYDPHYLSVKLLNPTSKQRWWDEVCWPTLQYLDDITENIHSYDKWSQLYWKEITELRKRIVNIAQYMGVLQFDENNQLAVIIDDVQPDPELIRKLKDYTFQLDKHRKQSIYDIMPHFDEIVNDQTTQ